MNTRQAHVHHCVPRWYQRRFLKNGQSKFYYLDLQPEVVTENGVSHKRRALLRRGPALCFCQNDLYTLKLGNFSTDEIERRFFGAIDNHGRSAVGFLSSYDGLRDGVHEAFGALAPYMGAQRFRTPRGLDWLKSQINVRDHSLALMAMKSLFTFHATMWAEGVWEIVRARQSPTKFIVTDDPVAFFNGKVFPGSKEGKYPGDVALERVGTRTVFPLSIDSCLLITHRQLVRNPWANVLQSRVNARAYQPTMVSLTDIQFGRELAEHEVLRINLILKKRATRHIAAAEEGWLYPEARVSTAHWSKLDDDWFLFPHLWKVPFSTEIVAGYKDGSRWAQDEYGRTPGDPQYRDKRLAEQEWDSHLRARNAWARKRAGRSVAHVDDTMHDDTAGDRLMEHYLERGN